MKMYAAGAVRRPQPDRKLQDQALPENSMSGYDVAPPPPPEQKRQDKEDDKNKEEDLGHIGRACRDTKKAEDPGNDRDD